MAARFAALLAGAARASTTRAARRRLATTPETNAKAATGAGLWSSAETDFGFSRVPVSQKSSLVADVFNRVAPKYDLMNDLMSLGVHRLWKSYFVDMLSLSSIRVAPIHILDVAGGTGDIAFRCIDSLRRPQLDNIAPVPRHHVTICDINQAMLDVGAERARSHGYLTDDNVVVDFLCADAQNLVTVPDNSVDLYTITFGLRNVTNKETALLEAHRVLKPGGRFLCMEFSKVMVPGLKQAYDMWSFEAIPRLGQLIAQDRASYQYLVESIRQFPSQDALCDMIRTAGLDQISYENLSGGIVAIHSGYKLRDDRPLSSTPHSGDQPL